MSTDELLDKLESADPDERALALLWIASHQPEGFVGDALRLLRDPDPGVRERAAWTLDQLEAPEAIEGLVSALNDTAPGVRSTAAWALVNLGEQVVPDVVEVLRHGLKDARDMAYQILKRIQTEEAREAIRRYWKE